MQVSTNVKALFSKARLLNTGFPTVILSESELYAILILICDDLGFQASELGLPSPQCESPTNDYYSLPADWFRSHANAPDAKTLQLAVALGIEKDRDFELYFGNLCSLHKRRLKFQRILSCQPIPTMDQVGTRSMLEYGSYSNKFLFNWLLWRKWIFDVDNRSGQETGYLFEPILANSLGGTPVNAKKSPVKRRDAVGNPLSGGRQIDCYAGDENLAYEFKIRLTIAASGQGRWSEELSFPRECVAAGIKPVLIVLDPTTSNRLVELTKVFLEVGGLVYVGDDAWSHIKERAGRTMAKFMEKYVRPALDQAKDFDPAELDTLSLTWTSSAITVRIGDDQRVITRDTDENCVSEEES